jgi:signal peptidase II
MPERSFRILLWTLALVGVGLDQGTKYGMFAWLKDHSEHTSPVFRFDQGPAFQLQARHQFNAATGENEPQVNSGALFGWLGDYKDLANNGFAVVSLLAALAIIYWSFRATTARDRWLCIALGLILAGTVGNLFDRAVFGGVRDFLDFYWTDAFAKEHHWPTFNIADCCLVSGAFLLLLQSFGASTATEKRPQATPATATAQPTGAP